MRKAPCGHDGEPVIGTFVNCRTPGCDGLPRDFADEEPTKPGACPKCRSTNSAPFHGWFMNARHCVDCGAVW